MGQSIPVKEKLGRVVVMMSSSIKYCMLETVTLCIDEASHGGELTFTLWVTERVCVAVSALTLMILIPASVLVHSS